MIVGSALNAKMNPVPGPKPRSTTGGFASAPNTNWDPALVNSRNCFTMLPTRLKNA